MKLDELLAGTPADGDRTFAAPWEARAFAMAVRLSESGVCTWEEFRRRLMEEIARADQARAQESGSPEHYYTYFLAALERLLRDKGLIDSPALEAKMREFSVPPPEDDS